MADYTLKLVNAHRAVNDLVTDNGWIEVTSGSFSTIKVPIPLPPGSFATQASTAEMLARHDIVINPLDSGDSVPWHISNFVQDSSGCFSFRLYNDNAGQAVTGKYMVAISKVK